MSKKIPMAKLVRKKTLTRKFLSWNKKITCREEMRVVKKKKLVEEKCDACIPQDFRLALPRASRIAVKSEEGVPFLSITTLLIFLRLAQSPRSEYQGARRNILFKLSVASFRNFLSWRSIPKNCLTRESSTESVFSPRLKRDWEAENGMQAHLDFGPSWKLCGHLAIFINAFFLLTKSLRWC